MFIRHLVTIVKFSNMAVVGSPPGSGSSLMCWFIVPGVISCYLITVPEAAPESTAVSATDSGSTITDLLFRPRPSGSFAFCQNCLLSLPPNVLLN